MLITFEGKTPQIHPDVYIENTAQIIGDVTIGKDSSVWYYTVIRGDIHFIEIGERVNIQDLCVVHVTGHKFPTVLGNDITIGHRAVLHGCIIEDRCLIGIGSVVLDGARIGPDCLLAAGSLVTPGFQATAGTLIMGSPAKCVRPLRQEELEMIETTKANYIEYARRYRASSGAVEDNEE